MDKILVTAIGSMSGDCVISALSEMGYTVLGCDIYPSEWHAITCKCENVYLSPLAKDEKTYIDFILNIIDSENISFIFPLTDIEIDVINKYRFLIEEKGVVICIANEKALEIARDKYKLYTHFRDHEVINVIPTYEASNYNVTNLIFPCVAKPRDGRSSEGLLYLNSKEHLKLIQEDFKYIIQEYKKGPVFTIDYVRSNDTGNDFSISRKELVRTKNGAGLTVEIIKDDRLENMVYHIGKSLSINGCVNMEFIQHEDVFYLIDINPRFSAGVAFSHKVGYNMVQSHLNCFTSRDILPSVDYTKQIIAKIYKEEILIKE